MFGITIAEFGLGCYKSSFIKKEYKEYALTMSDETQNNEIKSVYHLSKTEQNANTITDIVIKDYFPDYIINYCCKFSHLRRNMNNNA